MVTTETWCIYFALLYIAIKEALKLSKLELIFMYCVSQVDPSFVSWPDKSFSRDVNAKSIDVVVVFAKNIAFPFIVTLTEESVFSSRLKKCVQFYEATTIIPELG